MVKMMINKYKSMVVLMIVVAVIVIGWSALQKDDSILKPGSTSFDEILPAIKLIGVFRMSQAGNSALIQSPFSDKSRLYHQGDQLAVDITRGEILNDSVEIIIGGEKHWLSVVPVKEQQSAIKQLETTTE